MTERRAWWKEAVIYQIYPRSFADSDGDGIGDLNGITAHLDYLRDLGVDVLWLSPIYKSPNDDNGYDISDYRDIMTEFGTLEDFDRMLEEIHRRGMKLMMDLVVNHTSDEHRWFQESRKSKDNPYRDYYIWRDPVDGHEPNNWGSCFSGPAWKFDETTGQYFLHLFSPKQPDLNWENPQVRKEVFDMMNFWCDRGVDGFRMDVISMISKVPGLPDGAKGDGALYGDWGPFVCHGPHVHEYLHEMYEKVCKGRDLITVGETSGVTIEEARKYAGFDRGELNMVFQFEQCDITHSDIGGKWSLEKARMKDLRTVLNRWQTELEGKAWNSLYLCNHDQPRSVSRYGNDSDEWRELSAKMLATMLHMMKGSVYVYEGEELGMTNACFDSLSLYRDIETLNAYREYIGRVSHESMMARFAKMSRDNARTPMQWTGGPGAGFTTGTPWIPLNPNYTYINAAAQTGDPDSVYSYFRKLIGLRHTHPVIVYGRFEPLMMDSDEVYAYRRVLEEGALEDAGDDSCGYSGADAGECGGAEAGRQVLTVACNFTDHTVECGLADSALSREGEELISNYKEHIPGRLQPYEARVVLERG